VLSADKAGTVRLAEFPGGQSTSDADWAMKLTTSDHEQE
jgi:hypothetical protein